MTSTVRRRDLSVAELQAALAALWRGEFADNVPGRRATEEPPQLQGEARAGQPGSGSRQRAERSGAWASAMAAFPGPTVLVVAAHAGAGASTVAVLIGDTAAASGPARLIDCAAPVRSGVAAATDAELGDDGSGWRRARRGPLHVDRLADPVAGVEQVAAPRPVGDNPAGTVTVVDAAWPAWTLLHAAGWVTNLLHTAHVVIVCRPTVPGVRQLEQLLTALPGPEPVIAAVGPGKWPRLVAASCGPLLRAARDAGRVVAVPMERGLEETGLTAAALPKPIAAAGRALAAQLFSDPRPPVDRQRLPG